MKVIENTTAYKCEFCGKTSLNHGCMTQHERACKKNPKNRSMCYNCVHFDNSDQQGEKITGYYSSWNGENESTKTFYHWKCQHTDSKLFQPYHLNEFWKENLEEEGWTPMPSEFEGCPHFKEYQTIWSDTLGAIW